MNKKLKKLKADVIRWKMFSRKGNAVFRSLGREIVILTLSVSTLTFAAPQNAKGQMTVNATRDSLEEDTLPELMVTAARLPLPMEQTARSVGLITHEQVEGLVANSVNDVLKSSSSVDVRQRGPMGIQTDISINGGTHDQIVILLNGVNISSPHTGHLAADFPISAEHIKRIEILDGAASRVYGTSAFSGAVNIITNNNFYNSSNKKHFSGVVGVKGGSYGTFGADLSLNHQIRNFYNNVSATFSRSDGYVKNSNFERFGMFYDGGLKHETANIFWQVGTSLQNYGANTFYSGKFPNQYEQNRRLILSLGASTNGPIKLKPSVYWIHSTDHYQLIKHSHTGENYHMTDVYGINVNASKEWAGGVTLIGADFRNEGILSSSLGRPMEESQYVKIHNRSAYYTHKDNRTNVSYFFEHNILLDKVTLSAGLMANMNTSLDHKYRLYPGIDLSYRPTSKLKFFASWNMAQRMPTFTDLYYQSPTQNGNVNLKPEKASEFSVAANYRPNGFVLNTRLFYRHESSMIDWIMTLADSVNNYTTFHATNFKINNMGCCVTAEVRFRELFSEKSYLNSFSAAYTYIHQDRTLPEDFYASSYALDYLRHKLVLSLDTKLYKALSACLVFRWQDRQGKYVKYTPYLDEHDNLTYNARTVDYSPYGLLNLKLSWKRPRYDLYLEGENLTNHTYYDIGNVKQPGFTFMAGAKIRF